MEIEAKLGGSMLGLCVGTTYTAWDSAISGRGGALVVIRGWRPIVKRSGSVYNNTTTDSRSTESTATLITCSALHSALCLSVDSMAAHRHAPRSSRRDS